MADISTLQFGDNEAEMYSSEYRIKECRCRFNRTYDCCTPISNASCGTIELTVVAPGSTDLNLIEWYIDELQFSGRIRFTIAGDMQSGDGFTQEVCFEDAFCTEIGETYEIGKSSQRLFRLVMAPSVVTVMNVSFQRIE